MGGSKPKRSAWVSLSVGPRGAKYTIGPRGDRATVGIPGTGLSYTTTGGKRRDESCGGGDDDGSGVVESQEGMAGTHQPSKAETFIGYGLGVLLLGLGLCMIAAAIVVIVAGVRWILA